MEGAFPVADAKELASVFNRLMTDEVFCQQASKTCLDYLNSQLGATKTIVKGFKNALFS